MPNGSDRPPLKTTSIVAGTTLHRRKIGTRRHTRSLHGPLAARGTSKFSWCRRLLAGPAVRANNSELRAARHTELAHDLPHMNFDGTFPHPSRGAMALFVSPRLRSSRTARCLAVRLRFLAASSKSFLAPLPPPMTQEGMVMQSIPRRICAGSVCAGSFRTVILSSPRSHAFGALFPLRSSLYGRTKNSVNNRCRIAKHFRPKWNRSCAYFIGTSSHCVFSNTIQNLPCSGPRTRSRWGIRTGIRTRARLKQNENRRDGAATGPWSYLVVRSCGSGQACSPHSCRAWCPEDAGGRQARCDRFRSYPVCGPRPCRDLRFPRR